MLHAFGAPSSVPVIVLAYFVGQVANTLPIPGSVSGGIAGVLIAFGVSPALALPAVLAYRDDRGVAADAARDHRGRPRCGRRSRAGSGKRGRVAGAPG